MTQMAAGHSSRLSASPSPVLSPAEALRSSNIEQIHGNAFDDYIKNAGTMAGPGIASREVKGLALGVGVSP